MNDLPIPAEQLIPHRSPMRLISSLDNVAGDTASAFVTPATGNLFAYPDGRLDGLVFIEMLAQLTAAYNGYTGVRKVPAAPKMGYLVGIKHFAITGDAFLGESVMLEIQKETQFENVSYFSGRVLQNKNSIAEGALKLWEVAGTPPPVVLGRIAGVKRILERPQWLKRSQLHQSVIGCLQNLSARPDGGSADFILPEDFIAFRGHFPEYPILPGVFMLKMAAIVTELLLNNPVSVKYIKVAKFTRSVLPNARIIIECAISEEGSEVKIDSQIREKDVCAKIQMIAETE